MASIVILTHLSSVSSVRKGIHIFHTKQRGRFSKILLVVGCLNFSIFKGGFLYKEGGGGLISLGEVANHWMMIECLMEKIIDY